MVGSREPAHGDHMTVATVDLATLLKGVPRGEWVTLSSDMGRALTHGDDMQTVIDQAKALGESDPVIMRVPDPTVALIL